jgi:hypothetical protein
LSIERSIQRPDWSRVLTPLTPLSAITSSIAKPAPSAVGALMLDGLLGGADAGVQNRGHWYPSPSKKRPLMVASVR